MEQSTKFKILILGLLTTSIVGIIVADYINSKYINPETKEYKTITVRERFPGLGGLIISTDNERFMVIDNNLFWNMVPGKTYKIELTYNYSMADRMSHTATLTNATRIEGGISNVEN